MENVLKFQKSISGYLFGLIFVILLIINYFGIYYVNILINDGTKYYSNVHNTIYDACILIFIVSIGVLGAIVLDFLLVFVRSFADAVLKINLMYRVISKIKIFHVVYPMKHYIDEFYKLNKDQILSFFYLKSCSSPGNAAKSKSIQNFLTKKVGEYYDKNFNAQFIEYMDYNGSLTQEQAKRDSIAMSIKHTYYASINMILFFRLLFVQGVLSGVLFAFLGLFVVYGMLRIADEKKMRYASAVVYGFFDNFSVLEFTASMEDRDAVS
ncbi:MAG: hypothetical protein NW241_15900 [Bacteroidia bacterium]|nr:hypothetical protein [Bacteroidia bacterium]